MTSPSQLCTGNSPYRANDWVTNSHLYITAILETDQNLVVDDTTYTALEAVGLSSPIVCTGFTPSANGHVAYYRA